MDGVLCFGGNMRKKIIIMACLMALLTGCASKNSEIVLEGVASGTASEGTTEEAGAGGNAATTDLAGTDEQIVLDGSGTSADVGNSGKEMPVPEQQIAVFICGAVRKPGVYELAEESRIIDAVEAAGGFSEEADDSFINLAAKLTDGMKLKVPTKSEVEELTTRAESVCEGLAGHGTDTGNDSIDSSEYVSLGITSIDISAESDPNGASAGNADSNGLVNINTASAEQLKNLPGIGDGIAGKIIKYREENGAFKTKEDIMKVSGIKEKLFSKIKDSITV